MTIPRNLGKLAQGADTDGVLQPSKGGTGVTSSTGTGNVVLNTAPTLSNVVINSNSSTNALRITQTGTGNALVVEDSANPDSTPVIINASGQIIAGHTSAITIGAANQGLQVIGTGTNGNITIGRYTNDVTGSFYGIGKSRSTTPGSFATVNSSDSLGNFIFYGDDGTSFVEGARIAAGVDAAPATGSMPSRLVFSTTASGSSTPTERMRITSTGAVGIGGTPAAGRNLVVTSPLTGSTTSRAYTAIGTVQSDVTATASYFATSVSTQDAAFTLTNLAHFQALQGTISGGSRLGVTNQFGYSVDSSLTGATNNYGFFSNIASGTGRWNFYANGTAANFLAGGVIINNNLGVGSAASPSYGTSGQVLTSNGAGLAPSWQSASGGAPAFITSFTGGNTQPGQVSDGFGII